MQKRMVVGRGVKVLDQKNEGGGSTLNPPPASLRVNISLFTLFHYYLGRAFSFG